MARELRLPNPATFGDAHSNRVLALPGRERFRTGISLRVPSKKPSELVRPGSPEERIALFVSFPYFGKSSSSIQLGPESESVKLLDFRRLEVDVPDRSGVMAREEDDITEILVHQARYMVFDNCKLYPLPTVDPNTVTKKLPKIQWRPSDPRRMVSKIKSHFTPFRSLSALFT